MNKIYIFGAGASFGSQSEAGVDSHKKSPLTNDLFHIRYVNYAQNVGLSMEDLNEYRSAIDPTGLEKYLTDKWNAIETLKSRGTRQGEYGEFGSLTFYNWWMMQNISNMYNEENAYRKFIKKLKRKDENFSLISFNYDTFLDRAVQSVYHHSFVGSLSSYLENDPPLIKPHGSVNWFLQKRQEDLIIDPNEQSFDYTVRIDRASSLMFSGKPISMIGIRVVEPNHPDLNSLNFITSGKFNHQYFYPLVLIPLTTKLYPLIQDFHETVIKKAVDVVSRAEEIYLIGYRAQDEVASDILNAAPNGTRLFIIGLDGSDKIESNVLADHKNLSKGKVFKDGFARFVELFN